VVERDFTGVDLAFAVGADDRDVEPAAASFASAQ
jgi:hypothetical protein